MLTYWLRSQQAVDWLFSKTLSDKLPHQTDDEKDAGIKRNIFFLRFPRTFNRQERIYVWKLTDKAK